ncbi:MAG TPA: energy transducer TonB [Steroidobacteraceae bacterium]|nr:energy transducer TonB [Steroidobacteraceae bacterium]
MRPLAREQASGTEARSAVRNARSERIDVVVVCSDDALLIELGPVLGERYRSHSVDKPGDIAASVSAARWIGVVDADALPDARGAVARMELQFHRCPLILISSRPQEWSGAIARGAAVAVVPRQDAPARLPELLGAAEARLLTESQNEAPEHAAAGRSGRTAPHGGSALRWLAVAGVCVALGAGAWWLMHRPLAASRTAPAAASSDRNSEASAGTAAGAGQTSGTAPAPGNAAGSSQTAPAAQTAPALPAAKPQSVLELLSAARVAFRDQRLLLPRPDGEPRGDSALELYAQVLSQDPDNDEALDGVRRLFVLGRARIQADLASGRLDDATRLVGLFKDAGVGADALRELSAGISAARPKWLEQRAQQALASGDLKAANDLVAQLTAMGADPAVLAQLRRGVDARGLDLQLAGMATQVRAAIAAGNLLQPAEDNARARLAAMRTLARNHPTTLAALHDVQKALIERGGQATQAGQFDAAQRFLGAAADLGGSSTQLAAARHTLQAAIAAAGRRSAAAAAAAKAAAEAAAPPPPAPTVQAPAPHAPAYIAARPIHPLDVTYPPNTNVAGDVVVEFTLSPDGTASDMSVVSASPRGVFDQTAMQAVGSGHYDTSQLVGGEPVRARIRLRFEPN